MSSDYYNTLGVSRSASDADIKKAYRTLAHKYHPDKSGGDEQKFKEVNEAYQVLSNKEKRSQYDQFGQTFEGASRAGAGGQGGPFGGFDFGGFSGQGGFSGNGFEDVFSDFFGGGASRGGSNVRRGADIQVDVEIDFADMARDTHRDVRIRKRVSCDECGGSGGKPGTKEAACSACGGSGRTRKTIQTILGNIAQVVTCGSCQGKGRAFSEKCPKCGGAGRVQGDETIKVTLPAGVDDGQTLSISGKGEAGEAGSPAGTLYVTVHVRKHELFTRSGLDVLSVRHITLSQATLGDKIEVETLEGLVRMKVPVGTQSGEQFRIRSKGFPDLGGRGRGHHIVKVIVDVPKKLNREQKRLMEELRKSGV